MKTKSQKISVKQLLQEPYHSWEVFHEKTKWKKLIPPLPDKDWPENWKTIYFKEYPRLDSIALPSPPEPPSSSLKDALTQRKSDRLYNLKGLNLDQLSSLLYYSAGLYINKESKTKKRTYPSAGERYALEIYLISINSDLPLGVYHYNVKQHSLDLLLLLDSLNCDHYFNQSWIKNASCLIFFSAVFDRNTIKYGVRGYRYILQEAGHLGQNFYLNASALQLAICAIGGFVDNKLNKLLDVDGVKESVIYSLAVGNKLNNTLHKK